MVVVGRVNLSAWLVDVEEVPVPVKGTTAVML